MLRYVNVSGCVTLGVSLKKEIMIHIYDKDIELNMTMTLNETLKEGDMTRHRQRNSRNERG